MDQHVANISNVPTVRASMEIGGLSLSMYHESVESNPYTDKTTQRHRLQMHQDLGVKIAYFRPLPLQ
jgi:hypothetical protein